MFNPLVEIFGYPISNTTKKAEQCRSNKICPYNNQVPNCTKDKRKDPLGVCSFLDGDNVAIICPVRFRQNWQIVIDAADFFFPQNANWTSLHEVPLKERGETRAGNVDFVLVAYDDKGKIADFGSLEVQSVYISGNIRESFEYYMNNRSLGNDLNWDEFWRDHKKPHSDYLSSSRKRLVPQMIYKGRIFKSWGKKQVVALHKKFFETLPPLPVVDRTEADIAWMLYSLDFNESLKEYQLVLEQTVYTLFEPALERIVTPQPDSMESFIKVLQTKLKNEEKPKDKSSCNVSLSELKERGII
jgi:hypothetical protein